MEVTQVRLDYASRPEPGLWDRILESQVYQEKEPVMSSTPIALSNPPRRIDATPGTAAPRRKVGRWMNALAAVALIIVIGAGYWFSGYGPGGGVNGDSPRYAAQAVTPQASPEAPGVGCDVKPLTTDEVMAIVRNPLNPLNEMGVILAASPEPLLEASDSAITQLPELGMEVTVPNEQEFAAIEAAAQLYYDCLHNGSNSQIWALVAPAIVQASILDNFPVFRDEATIRAWVGESGPQPAASPFMYLDLLAQYRNDDYRFEANPERADAVMLEAGRSQDPRVVWIGTRVLSQGDGEIVSVTSPRPNGLRVGDSGEVLVLMQWPGSDTWFVTGTASTRWVD
jgi:hypothetical protein